VVGALCICLCSRQGDCLDQDEQATKNQQHSNRCCPNWLAALQRHGRRRTKRTKPSSPPPRPPQRARTCSSGFKQPNFLWALLRRPHSPANGGIGPMPPIDLLVSNLCFAPKASLSAIALAFIIRCWSTARSVASAGRSLIMTIASIFVGECPSL
jgi:hypothetical protein